MKPEELKEIIELHRKWLNDEDDGKCANLRSANLRSANLRNANLCSANLRSANLRNADLRNANLCGANLRNAKGIDATCAARLSIVPQCGSFIGWKKCDSGEIVKLLIPSDAKRSNATGQKCRCSKAFVLSIVDQGGNSVSKAESSRGGIYHAGEVIEPDSFDEDRWNECSHGIHFFITREEAQGY